AAAHHGLWLHLGSTPVRGPGEDGRFRNRSLLIAPDGAVAARYDKIHMFDVEIGAGESYRESLAFRPGETAVTADMPGALSGARLGLTICYDVRFPALHRALAETGAQVITSPAAFTVPTGEAHWEVLLRARAIETGCFVLAAAQVGTHARRADAQGPERRTWGHSLAVAPWGEVLADAGGEGPGIVTADLDLAEVAATRARVPALANARPFTPPRADAPAA
ncbi:MAG: carbon-nitrogen hydrolase family protein, partial [Pseudomonadota bacterium]